MAFCLPAKVVLLTVVLNAWVEDTSSYVKTNYLPQASGAFLYPSFFYWQLRHKKSLPSGLIPGKTHFNRTVNIQDSLWSNRVRPLYTDAYLLNYKWWPADHRSSIGNPFPSGKIKRMPGTGIDFFRTRKEPGNLKKLVPKKPPSGSGLMNKFPEIPEPFSRYLHELNKNAGVLNQFGSEVHKINDRTSPAGWVISQIAKENSKWEGAIREATTLVNQLKKKYERVENTDHLSSGTRKRKEDQEKFYLGGNFQVPDKDPVVLDLAPLLEYRINKNCRAGAGLSFPLTIDWNKNMDLSVASAGASTFFAAGGKHFFLDLETEIRYERSGEVNKYRRSPVQFHLGFGKEIKFYKEWIAQVKLFYILNFEGGGYYQNPLNIKFGLKRKVKP